MSTENQNSGSKRIYIIAIIALAALNIFQFFSGTQQSQKIETQVTEINELQKIQAELDQEYQEALTSLEELKGENAVLDSLIDTQKAELAAQKDKINNLIWSKKELNKAKEELKKMTASVTQYITEIDNLKQQNMTLSADNQQLTAKVDEVQKTNMQILEEKAAVTKERESLAKDNEVLGSKVDLASAIKINKIDVRGYAVKKDGKLKEKSKGKDMDVLKICFTTEVNQVTPSGQKKFYVRLLNPQGETISVDNKGSGVLTNKMNNTQVRYTTSGEITYKNDETNACIDWSLPEGLPKGDYAIELFNNGYPVGKSKFRIK